MVKQKRTVSINEGLIEWVQTMIEKKEFASLSHAIQKALLKLKESYEQ